jgi:putative endonuclease
MVWYTYIVRCKDGSFYTGITTDLKRRISEHNSDNKLGAKSLRRRRPVSLVYFEEHASQAEAAKRERSIKSWTREYKLKLIEKYKKNSEFKSLS